MSCGSSTPSDIEDLNSSVCLSEASAPALVDEGDAAPETSGPQAQDAGAQRRSGRYEYTNVIANRVRQLAANAPSDFYRPDRSLFEVAQLEFAQKAINMDSIRRLPGQRQERIAVSNLYVPWLKCSASQTREVQDAKTSA